MSAIADWLAHVLEIVYLLEEPCGKPFLLIGENLAERTMPQVFFIKPLSNVFPGIAAWAVSHVVLAYMNENK